MGVGQGDGQDTGNVGELQRSGASNGKNLCAICKKQFANRQNLWRHSRSMHGKGSKLVAGRYKCSTSGCPKEFSELHRLTSHMKEHAAGCFRCPDCDKMFAQERSMKRHRRKVHEQGQA